MAVVTRSGAPALGRAFWRKVDMLEFWDADVAINYNISITYDYL